MDGPPTKVTRVGPSNSNSSPGHTSADVAAARILSVKGAALGIKGLARKIDTG